MNRLGSRHFCMLMLLSALAFGYKAVDHTHDQPSLAALVLQVEANQSNLASLIKHYGPGKLSLPVVGEGPEDLAVLGFEPEGSFSFGALGDGRLCFFVSTETSYAYLFQLTLENPVPREVLENELGEKGQMELCHFEDLPGAMEARLVRGPADDLSQSHSFLVFRDLNLITELDGRGFVSMVRFDPEGEACPKEPADTSVPD